MARYSAPLPEFNADLIAHYADLAGEAYDWTATTGGFEQSSKFKRLIRADLAERQGYVCPACGVEFTTADLDGLMVEANHVVAQGGAKRGWFPGNVFVGHGECNKRTAPVMDPATGALLKGKHVLDMSDIARPDLIALEWTPLPALKRAAGYLK